MKTNRNILKFPAFILIFCLCKQNHGQDTLSSKILTGGEWLYCTEFEFSKDYQCINNEPIYEFFNDGIYKEDVQLVIMGKKIPYFTGKWTYIENVLTLDEYGEYPIKFNIEWLDNDRFYSIGQEGPNGPTVYIYFQRIN